MENISMDEQEIVLDREFLSDAQISEDNGVLIITRNTFLGKNNYLSEVVYLVPDEFSTVRDIEGELSRYMNETNSSGSRYEEAFDGSRGVKGWIRIFFSRGTTTNNDPSVRLTQVSGGHSVSDRQLKVTHQRVTFGCTGPRADGNGFITQTRTENPTGTSWSYSTSSWVAVNELRALVGGNVRFTVQRVTGATWTFEIINNL